MAPATNAEPRRVASGCTSDHSAKINPTQQEELDSIQAMASLYILVASQYMENGTTTINHREEISVEVDGSNVDDLLFLSLCYETLIRKEQFEAALASFAEDSVRVI